VRRRARVDANHAAVVQALRACGWLVWDTSGLGGGFPDVVVARAGVLRLVEIKDGRLSPSRRTLTPAEAACHTAMAAAGVPVVVVASVAEAVALI
jgi:hypothetical protein